VKAHLGGILNAEVAEPAKAEDGDNIPRPRAALRKALKVVRPAHISGAASAGGRSAGMSATALAGAIMYSA
jgi:hypothetical protein